MNSKHELIAPASPDPIIVTRSLIKRAWSDFEPKLVAGLMSGTVASGLINLLNAYGIHLPVPVISSIPVAAFMLAGWITSSVGTVTTMRTGDGLVVEKHSGSVEIKTGAIPIPGYTRSDNASSPASVAPYSVPRGTYVPPAPVPTPAPTPPSDPEPYEVPDQGAPNTDAQFTQVIQPDEDSQNHTRAGAILSRLGNRTYESDGH